MNATLAAEKAQLEQLVAQLKVDFDEAQTDVDKTIGKWQKANGLLRGQINALLDHIDTFRRTNPGQLHFLERDTTASQMTCDPKEPSIHELILQRTHVPTLDGSLGLSCTSSGKVAVRRPITSPAP